MDFENKVIKVSSNIVIKIIEGEAVIVSPKEALITSLNFTGTFIIESIEKGINTFDHLLEAFLNSFDVNYNEAKSDLIEFLELLYENSLIEVL